jgi:hypothetical protein
MRLALMASRVGPPDLSDPLCRFTRLDPAVVPFRAPKWSIDCVWSINIRTNRLIGQAAQYLA